VTERFSAGERVRVRADFPPGHVRTPVYVRGKTGVVTRRFGAFKNPELAAYRLAGPNKVLYQVRFRQADLWPDYAGPDSDTVDLDLYDHWLEKI
jgi:nitrile hydratase subunit beta